MYFVLVPSTRKAQNFAYNLDYLSGSMVRFDDIPRDPQISQSGRGFIAAEVGQYDYTYIRTPFCFAQSRERLVALHTGHP